MLTQTSCEHRRRTQASAYVLLIFLIATGLGACYSSSSSTTIDVSVDVDGALSLDEIRLTLSAEDRKALVSSRAVTAVGGRIVTQRWHYAIEGVAGGFVATVLAEGLRANSAVASSSTRVAIEPAAGTRASLRLTAPCKDSTCADGGTCNGGGCSETDAGRDGGSEVQPIDAELDSSIDKPANDLGPTDAFARTDAEGPDGPGEASTASEDAQGTDGVADRVSNQDAGPDVATSLSDGEPCGGNAECASGHCVDGVCCDTACTGRCMACSASKTAGKDGQCAPIQATHDPDQECGGSQCSSGLSGFGLCNGAGECKVYTAVPCAGNFDCPAGAHQCTTRCTPGTTEGCRAGFVCTDAGTCQGP
jgi:hypothetical protein